MHIVYYLKEWERKNRQRATEGEREREDVVFNICNQSVGNHPTTSYYLVKFFCNLI